MTHVEAIEFLKNQTPLRITVSGDIGSGKSTFAKHLAEILNIERIYAGQIMREEAARQGVTLQEFNELLEVDDEVDKRVDELQTNKSKEIEKGVFEGRTAWHFIINPDIKVFLSVNSEIGAERVYADKTNTLRDKYSSLQEVIELNAKRKISEKKRYNNYYNIDVYDFNNFDLIIDTSTIGVKEVFESTVIKIAQFLSKS